MAKIRPFNAIRPAAGLEEKIAALPYDVYNRKEAVEAVKGNDLSFLRIDRAETAFDDSVDTYDDRVYKKADELFRGMLNDGSFVKDDRACYYIYELTMDGRAQTGIVACASIDDYINSVIKKHENTRADKEVDRIRHVDALSAQTGPIFLAYRAEDIINQVVDKVKTEPAVNDFVSDDGIRHRVWIIDDESDIKDIEDAFSGMDSIYIADGHHRCASAVKVGLKRREEHKDYTGEEEFNYFLSVLFPDEQLMIMDYNRVIKDLNGHTTGEVLDELGKMGALSARGCEPFKPEKKGQVSVYAEGKWYSLDFDEKFLSDDPVKGLDVSILQDNVLKPLFGIEDPKTDKRIDFVGGIRGLKELERRCAADCKMAFAMYPTSIQELFNVADAGLLMPPKSTWFEPKLRSGLFIHDIS
ncbi:MAG TPA: DUF1015 domain-containing protein [Lachnospiraceae bacterium]|nr:DUF1015 domain-containing protein [Lachnospiraceae bacterium]